jgi:NAD dependent epimerase/dehydratase family enzyme
MSNELKQAIDQYLINYINLCNENINQARNNKRISEGMLLALNDSTRVIVSHIRKQNPIEY